MAKIYNTVQEEIRRKSNERGFENYLNMLLSLYSPKDLTHEKFNLLTIYINNSKDVNALDLFFKKGHSLQIENIKPSKWDDIIEFFMKNDNLNELEIRLPIKNNISYTLLCVPTIHRLELFKKYHKPGFSYESKNYNLINDIFKSGFIKSTYPHVLSDMKDILKTIYFDKGLDSQSLQGLLDDKVVEAFKNQFENYLKIDCWIGKFLSLKAVATEDNPKYIARKILEDWKLEIEHDYLEKNLIIKNDVHSIKIKI